MGRKGLGESQTMVSCRMGNNRLVTLLLSVRIPIHLGRLCVELVQYALLFAGFNGYLLLGHYLRNHDWSWSKTLSVCIPMFLAGYMVTFFGFRHMTALPQCTDEMLELFFTYNSLNVIMMTIPFFLIAKKVKVRSELIQRMLANLTVCGFGIYMIHYFSQVRV